MTAETRSVGSDFPREQRRVRELLEEYVKLGPTGAFGAAMLRQALERAEEAQASGDVVAIVRAYAELKECQ